jgi:hypothetical protein
MSATGPTGLGGREPVYGSFSDEKVAVLKAALARVTFPAKEGTIGRLLPGTLKPLWVRIVDWKADPGNKGRVGGNVVEYWLNHDQVLEVATAYYSVDGKHFSLEEWCVMLSRAERDNFSREIY